MPRRKPDKVIENRNSLGTLERDLERDRIGAEYAQAVATGVAGIAQAVGGIGIGGGILLGAVFFKGEIQDAVDAINDFLPNTNPIGGGGPFLSPEWIATWGDDPSDVVAQDDLEPQDETAVDTLVNPAGQTVAGKTPFQAYRIGAVGRDAEYTHRIQSATLSMTPAELANFMNYPSSHPPPHSQSMDGYAYQLAIRETVCRRIVVGSIITVFLAGGVAALYAKRIREVTGYISDPMLDWAACTTYSNCDATISNQKKEWGRSQIEHFMYWQP